MNRFFTVALAAVSPLFFQASTSISETSVRNTFSFFADAVSLPDEIGKAETKIFIVIPPGASDPSHRLYVSLEIKDSSGKLVEKRNSIVDSTGFQAAGLVGWFLPRFDFRLPQGEFTARIKIEDVKTEVRQEMRLVFGVTDQSREAVAVSDLLFGVCHEYSTAEFGKRAWERLTPRPSRRFGDRFPELCVSAEVVSLSGPQESTIEGIYEVKDRRGGTLQKGDFVTPLVSGKGAILIHPEIAGLDQGRYELLVRIRVQEGWVERKGWFEIDTSRIAFSKEGKKWRQVLGYIAANRELITLQSVSDDSLKAFWDRFWRIRDPNPKTKENEGLDEFVRRVEVASRRFGSLQPGWETDRGRVYIQFGEPDRIDEVVGHGSRRPSRTWIYDQRQRTFRFEDRDGFGAFVLVGSGRP